MTNEYALYKNDECIGIGTLKELSEKFKVKEKTLLFYGTNAYKKRTSYKAKRLIKL